MMPPGNGANKWFAGVVVDPMGAARLPRPGPPQRRAWPGLGRMLKDWAVADAVQLATDNSRPDTHRFYESLGFLASHEGMKLAP